MTAIRISIYILSGMLAGGLPTVAMAQATLFADANLEAAVRVRLGLTNWLQPVTVPNLLGLTDLRASGLGITNLAGLQWATNLTELWLPGNQITNITPLQGLKALTHLGLDGNFVGDLAPLAGLTNLRHLDMGGNPIESSSTFLTLTNLTSIFAHQSLLTNLSFAQNLFRLTTLNVHGNGISDFAPVSALTNLTCLDARWNAVTNFAFLSACTNLTRLYLGGNGVSNLSFLTPLRSLSFLNLEGNQVRDLSALSGLTNLSYVVVSGNPGITNYAALSDLGALANLEARNNSISNLSFISGLNQLRFLDLANNRITSLSAMSLLTNLSAIDLSGNPILSYSFGSARPSSLWLFGNSISNLSFVSALTQLKALGLDDNLINDIVPLAGLTNLQSLSLSRNPVFDYSPLEGMTNLVDLWLDGSELTDVAFLEGLYALKNLSLCENCMSDLDVLGGIGAIHTLFAAESDRTPLTNLVTVYVDHNCLTNIAGLTNLPNLGRVGISENLMDLRVAPVSNVLWSLRRRAVEVDVFPTNQPVSLWFALQVTNAGALVWYVPANQTSSLSFHVSHPWLSVIEVQTMGYSSNQVLLMNTNISVTGTNSNRLLTIVPGVNKTGTALLSLRATQPPGGMNAVQDLLVTVLYPSNVLLEPNLAQIISTALQKPDTNLTSVDLLQLTELFGHRNGIGNLSGLEWASNLAVLSLEGNSVSNLAPLQKLWQLGFVNLRSNLVANASLLAGLTNLTQLDLGWNPFTNYAGLAGFTNLTSLYLPGNSITNIGSLSNLSRLTELDLSYNRLTNIPALSGAISLALFHLQQNRLVNAVSLTNLPQLAYVDVRFNLLGEEQWLDTLVDKDVLVDFYPQRAPPVIAVRTNWFVACGSNSILRFAITDTGPKGEQLGVGASVSGGAGLVPGLILAAGGTNEDWQLFVTNQILTNALRWLTISATNDVGLRTNALVRVQMASVFPLTAGWFGDTNLVWLTGGQAPWFGQEFVWHAEDAAAQSGTVEHNRESWLQTTLAGPGMVKFWWRVSSELDYDWLEFTVADYTNRISGEVDWRECVANVPPGPQTLTWRYYKDDSVSGGWDAGWLDGITFVPGTWLEIAGKPASNVCQLIVHAVPEDFYEVEVSTNLATWEFLGELVPTNSSMPFLDVSAGTGLRFYRLRQILPVLIDPESIRLESLGMTNGLFRLLLHSPPSAPVAIQAASSPNAWTTLVVLTNYSGITQYTDPSSTGSSWRIYRARLLEEP